MNGDYSSSKEDHAPIAVNGKTPSDFSGNGKKLV